MRVVRPSTFWTTLGMAAILGGGVAIIAAQVHPWAALTGLLVAAVVLWSGLRRSYYRWRIARMPFPDNWHTWLMRHVPPYAAMDEAAGARFQRDVQFLMEEFSFEGVQGVRLTDELCLSVAAAAALLLHGHPDWELPGTRSILFYPNRFDDYYTDGYSGNYDGMAHEQGPLIMSAPSVRASWMRPADGDNVVLHELAHLFDFDNTGPDGVPSFVDGKSAASWQALVRTEMKRIEQGQSILDPYASTAPSEFFAVAVEHFFEQPAAMRKQHPELFEAMTALFNWTPQHPTPDEPEPPEAQATQ